MKRPEKDRRVHGHENTKKMIWLIHKLTIHLTSYFANNAAQIRKKNETYEKMWIEWIKSKLSHFTSELLSMDNIAYIATTSSQANEHKFTLACARTICAAVCRLERLFHFSPLDPRVLAAALTAVTSQTILWLFIHYFVTSIIRLKTTKLLNTKKKYALNFSVRLKNEWNLKFTYHIHILRYSIGMEDKSRKVRVNRAPFWSVLCRLSSCKCSVFG